jgi:GNAT superfamily N-acetyltransferase
VDLPQALRHLDAITFRQAQLVAKTLSPDYGAEAVPLGDVLLSNVVKLRGMPRLNCAILGLSAESQPAPALVDQIIAHYSSRSIPAGILCRESAAVGLERWHFERQEADVLTCIDPMRWDAPAVPEPQFDRVTHDSSLADEWVDVFAKARVAPSGQPALREVGRSRLLDDHGYHFIARLDGIAVMAGSMLWDGEACSYWNASVLPEARRRGLQQAALQHRCAVALKMGLKRGYAVLPEGSSSLRNCTKHGFEPFARQVLMVRSLRWNDD